MNSIIKLIFLISLVSSTAFAKHIGVKVTNKGITNLLTSAINSYAGRNKNLNNISIKPNTIYNRIEKKFFDTNPIIQKIKGITNFEQNEDFVFYVDWSAINIDADVVPGSLKIGVVGQERNFTASIRLTLNKLMIHGNYIAICELKKWKCNKENAVYGRFNRYKISLNRGEQVDIAAVLNVHVSKGIAELEMQHFLTNLVAPANSTERALYNQYDISTRNVANFDISFKDFIIPPPKLTVNGTTVELDVSKLKDAILSEKNYLSAQLAKFAGDFITKDLTKILNNDFFGKLKDLKTTLTVLDYDAIGEFEEEETVNNYYHSPYQAVVDNTYVAPNYALQYERFREQQARTQENEPTFMEQFLGVIRRFIYKAKFDLTYLKTKSESDKNLVIDFTSTLKVNDKTWKLSDKIKNGKAYLKNPSFKAMDSNKYDVAVALSESMINGALKLAVKDGLVQGLFDTFLASPGVKISQLALHFEEGSDQTYRVYDPKIKQYKVAVDNTRVATGRDFTPTTYYDEKNKTFKTVTYRSRDAIVAVAVLTVDMWAQQSDGFLSWIENTIGAVLEKGMIWFPVEIKFYPQIVRDSEGNTTLELYAVDPFNYKGLRNTYGYPYKDMKGIVHKGLLEKLKEMLKPATQELPSLDLSNYLSFPGLELQPVKVYVKSTGHLVITTNITKLDLKELSELESKK